MKIDNFLTPNRIKKALSLKTMAIILIAVTLLSVVFYVTVNRQRSQEVLIWLITTEADEIIPSDALDRLNEYGAEKGIDKILLTRRHPEDRYFDVIMSTTAFYSCDVFIMTAEMAEKYSEMDMFLALDYPGDESLMIGGEPVGIHLFEDYYFFINSESDVDVAVLYGIFDILGGK